MRIVHFRKGGGHQHLFRRGIFAIAACDAVQGACDGAGQLTALGGGHARAGIGHHLQGRHNLRRRLDGADDLLQELHIIVRHPLLGAECRFEQTPGRPVVRRQVRCGCVLASEAGRIRKRNVAKHGKRSRRVKVQHGVHGARLKSQGVQSGSASSGVRAVGKRRVGAGGECLFDQYAALSGLPDEGRC